MKKPRMARGKSAQGPPGKRQRRGPRLPTALRREIDAMGPNPTRGSDDDEGSDSAPEDVYEYEEGVPEEEAGKNGRYDAVENYEYEFDSDASNADEDVPSDEGEDMDEGDDQDDDDEERQIRILQETTGMPREAFDGKKKNKQPLDLPLQPGDGDGPVTINDLLENIQGKSGYSKLRKRLQQQEKGPMVVAAPLPKSERERLDRAVTYNHSKKEMTKWAGIIKRNREAPTLYFENDLNLGVNSVGAIASEFKPRTKFEMEMAQILQSKEMIEAHKNDGAKILELNQIDAEDVRERQNRLAKMRSLLFRHEIKAKRVKRIKSKTYHRMLKKDKLKAASADLEVYPDAAKEYAEKQERKRAEGYIEAQKNTSKWALRIKKRGLDVQDEGTRAAVAAQLQQHALLTRKMNSMKDDSSSSDESSDDDEEESESEAKLLNRGKEKILRVLEEDNEMPKSGVFSLPFMERAMKKHEEATYEEAQQALKEYDESLRKLEDGNSEQNEDPIKVAGPKTTFEVGMLVDNSWKKVKSSKGNGNSDIKDMTNKSKLQVPPKVDPIPNVYLKSLTMQQDQHSDSDSEEEMVEGFLTISDSKESYELPSQADLIRQAFAGDDVEAEFEKDKMEFLNEENPEPEKPALVPGWGQWTDIQQKKGLPSWMVKEHETAKRNREEALKRRKDSKLKHVIISEQVDKKEAYEQSIRMPIGPDYNPAISVSALNRPAIVKKPGVVIKPIQYEEVNPHEKPDEPKRVIQRVTPNPNVKKYFAKQAKVAKPQKRK
ncbi:hypothetical protein PR202_gb19833 [Eleusine coracana subsp. coracana]|uniref:Uncharacterized protein n=1 Tax=Eleusine coracana subsp. coracana TaxID=191504 RepID=A0AAV5F701_ELECO|nr:hypothetical protein PR202_gb19833 [Eleusine coracana subsp. coracana]